MYVLADIEWVTNSKGFICPTQLSAIKADEDWNMQYSFYSRIRPLDDSFEIEKHMAFSGAGLEVFRIADSARKVFTEFEQWLDENDIVCWWECNSDETFSKLFNIILKRDFMNKTLCLKPYVEYALAPSGLTYKGNPYSLAQCRKINVPLMQHHAYNDVKTLLSLLRETGFDRDLLSSAPLPVPKEYMPKTIRARYSFNRVTEILHMSSCPNAGEKRDLSGIKDLRTAVKKKYTPCDCCKDEYEKEEKDYRQWKIEQSGCNFIYLKDSDVFHSKDCRFATCKDDICFSNSYKRLVNKGRRPCKICSPEPVYDESDGMQREDPLPKEQLNAVARFNRSTKLRNLLLDAADNETQRKDAFTLTKTANVFFAGRGYSDFHLASCPKMNGLSEISGFSKFSDALKAGYTPCKHCRPTAKQDAVYSVPFYSKPVNNESVDEIETVCAECGFSFSKHEDYVRVETPVGIWKAFVRRKPVVLEHINLAMQPENRFDFHKQPMMLLSFIDTIQYIKKHDYKLMQNIEENNGIYSSMRRIVNL